MGILNVTPDSFSDGGRFLDPDEAVAHGLALAASGAHIIDVGGESTRPGSAAVSLADELARVIPVVERLALDTPVPISIDTRKAAVADAAIAAGATIVNDVSAGRDDPELVSVVAARGCGLVLMHMLGDPTTMQIDPRYGDVVADVGGFLRARIDAARDAGVADAALFADPGIGFGKTADHNLALLAAIPALSQAAGVPLVVGTSRKAFLGAFGATAEAADRDDATLATTIWAWEQGAHVVRVHDVASAARAARLLDVMDRATPEGVLV